MQGSGAVRDRDDDTIGGTEDGAGPSTALAVVDANSCSCLQQQRGPEGGKALAVSTGAEYLRLCRSFQGLQTPATGAEVVPPTLAVQGMHGRAATYSDEPPST